MDLPVPAQLLTALRLQIPSVLPRRRPLPPIRATLPSRSRSLITAEPWINSRFTGALAHPPAVRQCAGAEATKGLVMGYFDGNTVTALWNYANNFALNDNTYTSQFGPSTPPARSTSSPARRTVIGANTNSDEWWSSAAQQPRSLRRPGRLTLIGDAEPLGDVCSNTSSDNVSFTGKNIGDLLNAKGLTWAGSRWLRPLP